MQHLLRFLYAAVPVTLVCLLIYMAGQQVYRQSVNDPQVAMAQDAAARLNAGEAPAALVSRGTLLDISTSLSPWIAIYDSTGLPLESSAQFDGAPPKPPQGVFDNAAWWAHGHSWQPREGVRFSIAVAPFSFGNLSGYVVAGRSMRLVEERIIKLGQMILVGWLAILGALLVVQLLYVFGGRITHSGARGG